MEEEIKILANKVVNEISERVKEEKLTSFHKFGSNIDIGADGSPTKYVDKIAEDIAVETIKNANVNVNLLSEEAGFLDLDGECTFVLDPVDGTRNASRGIPFFSVSLAVGKNKISDLEFGIVKNIPTEDLFVAEKSQGAFLNNKKIGVPEVPLENFLSCLVLGKNSDKVTLSLASEEHVRALGAASLEMCMVAIGAVDLYVAEKEYLRVTDIAASTLIVREAGGVVKNIYNDELDMDLNIDDKSSVVAACNEHLIEDIVF